MKIIFQLFLTKVALTNLLTNKENEMARCCNLSLKRAGHLLQNYFNFLLFFYFLVFFLSSLSQKIN